MPVIRAQVRGEGVWHSGVGLQVKAFGNGVAVDWCNSQRVSKIRYGSEQDDECMAWQDDVCR